MDIYLAGKEIKAISVQIEEEVYKLASQSTSSGDSPGINTGAQDTAAYRDKIKLIIQSFKDPNNEVFLILFWDF